MVVASAGVTVKLNEELDKPLVWLKGSSGGHWRDTEELCSQHPTSVAGQSAETS